MLTIFLQVAEQITRCCHRNLYNLFRYCKTTVFTMVNNLQIDNSVVVILYCLCKKLFVITRRRPMNWKSYYKTRLNANW